MLCWRFTIHNKLTSYVVCKSLIDHRTINTSNNDILAKYCCWGVVLLFYYRNNTLLRCLIWRYQNYKATPPTTMLR